MALVEGKPACVIAPLCEVSMKKLAAAFGGKSAQMMIPAEAERTSGYKVGGISPFGQMRKSRRRSRRRRWRKTSSSSTAASADCRCG